MANERPQAQGTLWSDGTIKYADVLGSSIAPKNNIIPNNCRYTYSDGRWSTRKKRDFVFYSDDVPEGADRYVNRQNFPTEFEVQSNIPITTLTGSGDYGNTATPAVELVGSWSEAVLSQNPARETQDESTSIQLGMNMTSTPTLVSEYRPIVNWNYNKVALYPMIVGIYETDYGVRFDFETAVDLRDFYRNYTKPPHNENLRGYAYIGKIAVQDSISNIDDAKKYFNFADEFYIKNESYTGKELDFRIAEFYGVNMWGCVSLLGSIPLTTAFSFSPPGVPYGIRTWGTVWTGGEYIEGIPVREDIQATISHLVYDEFPVIPIDTLDTGLLNELDLTKIALQCGLPVISNSAVLSHFVYDKDDLGDLAEDYPDDVYYPKIADGRVSTEEYFKGEDVKDSPYYEAGKQGKGTLDPDVTPITDIEIIDTNNYVDEIDLNEPPVTPLGKFSHYYMLSNTDIEDLVDFLFTSNTSTYDRILEGLKMFGENPMRFIVGLSQFPLDLTQFVDDVASEEITIGNGVTTGITAEKFDTARSILNFGSVKYRRFFGNFLDYAPYTQCKLYLPYCNEIELDTQIFAGKTITVKYIIDWITGNCTAVVGCGDIPVYYVHGQVGVNIGLSGEDKSDYVNQGLSAISRVAGGAITSISGISQTATGASGGNIGAIAGGVNGIVSGGLGIAQGVFDFAHPKTPIETNGTSTSTINFYKPQSAYCILKQSKIYNVDGYAHTVGYACEFSSNLVNLTGWTVCANVKNITPDRATEKEIAEIKALLESGVYL